MPRNSSSVNFSPKSRAMRFRFLLCFKSQGSSNAGRKGGRNSLDNVRVFQYGGIFPWPQMNPIIEAPTMQSMYPGYLLGIAIYFFFRNMAFVSISLGEKQNFFNLLVLKPREKIIPLVNLRIFPTRGEHETYETYMFETTSKAFLLVPKSKAPRNHVPERNLTTFVLVEQLLRFIGTLGASNPHGENHGGSESMIFWMEKVKHRFQF